MTLRARGVLPALVVLGVYAALAGWRVFVATANPHAFMADPRRCPECHMEPVPAPGRPYRQMNFRVDIVSLCSRCHPRPMTHPVDIAPGKGLTRALPLDPDGTMTCITCHAPHSASRSGEPHVGRSLCARLRDACFPFLPGKHRTCYLRIPAVRGKLCDACHARRPFSTPRNLAPADPSLYAGSGACAACHPSEHRQWLKTPHARMVRSPRRDPKALLARFSGASPFPASEIAYVLGSRNVQRFISRKGDSLVVRTPIWLVRAKTWNLSYWREMDWFRACAGCHTTAFDPVPGRYAEEGIGCEACHGPGRAHAASGRRADIVNPAKLSAVRRAMVCESCHTSGHDATGEFRFPVGYLPGRDLRHYYFGLTPRPGQDDTSFKGDGSYTDRHGQFLFWQANMLIAEGETCDLCKNFRLAGRAETSAGPRKMSAAEFCRSCHDGTAAPWPAQHHAAGGGGGRCLSCHPPLRAADGGFSIHDHKYLPPEALEENDFIPKPDYTGICFRCHPSPAKGA